MTMTPDIPENQIWWVDLACSDVEQAKNFYGELFDWTSETLEHPDANGYTFFSRDGHRVAGCGPLWR